jgi:hypothetical protein
VWGAVLLANSDKLLPHVKSRINLTPPRFARGKVLCFLTCPLMSDPTEMGAGPGSDQRKVLIQLYKIA